MARVPGFVGGTSLLRSRKESSERSVNLYPEIVEGSRETSIGALIGTPGLLDFANLDAGGVRGMWENNGRCWVVAGPYIFELFADGTFTKNTGAIIGGSTPVSIAVNATQVLIGTGSSCYLYTMASGTVQVVGAPGGGTVTFLDGYFIATVPGTTQFNISALNDGTQWDGLDFANKEGNPDNLIAAIMVRRQLWLLGDKTTEIWWNSGNNNFPFQPIPNIILQQGCAASFSPVVANNGLYWIGKDVTGTATVWGEQNFAPVRVSNRAIEEAMDSYTTIADAVGFAYQENGHTFAVWSFPTANATWVLDISNGLWHERGYWNIPKAQYDAVLGRYHVAAFGKHLVGDYNTGQVYVQTLKAYTDLSNPIRRLRQFPHMSSENKRCKFGRMELEIQTGVVPSSGQGSNPIMIRRFSNDGGFNFSNEKQAKAGKSGEFKSRCIWRQSGSGRDRVEEITSTEPIEHVWLDAYMDAQVLNG